MSLDKTCIVILFYLRNYYICKLLTSLIILSDIDIQNGRLPSGGKGPTPATTGEYIVCKLLTSFIILSDIDTENGHLPSWGKAPTPATTGEYIVCKLLT